MFYEKEHDPVLRFGDVVRGFVSSTPELPEPFLTGPIPPYRITVASSGLAVIMSPCCSIANEILSLVPLQQISLSFFQNPYLVEDLTRVNRKMAAEKTVPPHKWRSMPQEVKEREFNLEEDDYAFSDFFVYAAHPSLPEYVLHKHGGPVRTGFHMIDFKAMFRVDCEKVRDPADSPVDAKLLQLSLQSRAELRMKVAAYFSRIPAEDQV